ncbi:MAG: PD-(D/E)XK nuclease-like domain-containing protein [Xanthomonadaceae bacterium]|nr:PD-(D/E)XK nuclease-like domain-containing protein [Xanthomonadaceae bacterium]
MIVPASDLPIEQYHASAPAWLSKTTLRYFADNGAPWFKLFLDGQVKPSTPGGVEQGAALDCLLTENGADFDARFAIKPKGHDGRTKEGKAWVEANSGKKLLTENDMAILADAAAAVRACSAWPRITKSMAQATVRRQAPALGLGLQSRPDWLLPSEGCVFDLKKTSELRRFGAQSIDLGYHLQAAVAGWCLAGDGVALEHAYLVAVEWERGARCRIYEIPHEVLEHADTQMREIAAEIGERLASGNWTDHQEQVEPLPVPGWMLRQMEAVG